jgi:nicotinamide-nucleotide amidase
MIKNRKCAVISLGNELTSGAVQDTHLSYLGNELNRLAISIDKHVIITDDTDLAASEILSLSGKYPLIFVTGGLGPTSDDITREAVSSAAGVELEFNPEIWKTIEQRFAGRKIAESNKKQANIPRGFNIIENKWGTAPGVSGVIGECRIVVLPGPPRELSGMFAGSVITMLRQIYGIAEHNNLRLSIFMVSESEIEDAYSKFKGGAISLHTRLAEDRVIVLLEGDSEDEREEIFAYFEKTFGSVRVRRPDTTASRLLFDALSEKRSTIAFAESCTGGLLSKWITDIPGSSAIFWGGFITYSNDSKSGILGVDPLLIEKEGAVSRSVALEMARCAIRKSGADYSIAVSGIAGPDGGTLEKPVGTVWISIAGKNLNNVTRSFYFTGNREWVRTKTAVSALLLAEYFISEKEGLDRIVKW